MDESFLSDKEVVAATRNYVCIRAATYEIEEEVPFLNSLFRGRSPELENTVFSLLAPDGHTQISPGGRSAYMAFRTNSNQRVIKELEKASAKHKIKNPELPSTLPFATDLRMGLNVAACDNQPLVVCLGPDKESLRKIEKSLAADAWSEKHIGLFHYASSSKAEAAKLITDLRIDSGFVVIQPNQFGTKATILAEHASGNSSRKPSETLDSALTEFDRKRPGETRSHVRAGKRSGVHWETATPITDTGGPRREDDRRRRR